jgi:phage tail-like protein
MLEEFNEILNDNLKDGLNQVYNHPPSGFHFSVIFEDYSSPTDMMFQEVSGLSCSTSDTIPLEEGGAAYVHERPSLKYKYDDLELKRGLTALSPVSNLWIRNAVSGSPIQSTNIFISLLDEYRVPIYSWYVVGAYPIAWNFSPLDATKGEVMIETITLKYQYFSVFDTIIADAATDATFGSI